MVYDSVDSINFRLVVPLIIETKNVLVVQL